MNLIVIDTEGNQLADAPAASFVRMLTDGMPRDDVTVGYRSRDRQAELYAGWVKRLPGYNFALPPGQSRHEVGYALDVAEPMRSWMAAHAAAYGWRRTNKNEPWHFEYFYPEDRYVGRVPVPEPITPIPQKEDDMYDAAARHERNWITVSEWYPMLIGRPGLHAEISMWADQVRAGSLSMGQVYTQIYNSDAGKRHRGEIS